MGLIKCPDCGHDVSDKAPACRNCGLPNPASAVKPPPPQPPKRKVKPEKALTFLGVVLLAGGVGCLLADQTVYAGPGLGAGLLLTLAGSLWAWVIR